MRLIIFIAALCPACALLGQVVDSGKPSVVFPNPATAGTGEVYVVPTDEELAARRAAALTQFQSQPPSGEPVAYKHPEAPNFFSGMAVMENDDTYTAVPVAAIVKRAAQDSVFKEGKAVEKKFVPFKDFKLPETVVKLTGDWKDGKAGTVILVRRQEIDGDAVAVDRDGLPAPGFEWVN